MSSGCATIANARSQSSWSGWKGGGASMGATLSGREVLAPAVGDRDWPVAAGVARRALRTGRELATLVLGTVDETDDPFDECGVESLGDEIRRPEVAFDVGVEHLVEQVVRRQGVGVELPRSQLRRRRLRDRVLRDRRLLATSLRLRVPPSGQVPDESLRNVLDGRVAANGVAVDRRVAGRQLALVAAGEHEVAVLVRQAHPDDRADPCLEVLLGKASQGELLGERVDDRRNRDDVELKARTSGKLCG